MASNEDEFASTSESEMDEMNSDVENNGLDEIVKANQEYIRASNQKSNYEFGFENVAKTLNTKQIPNVENKGDGNKRGKKRKNGSGQGNGPPTAKKQKLNESNSGDRTASHRTKNPIAIAGTSSSVTHAPTNENDAPHSGANSDKNSTSGTSSLWNTRKLSNTRYLDEYFHSVGTMNGKMQICCKLCDPNNNSPFSVTTGNNSNLMKHLRQVSYFMSIYSRVFRYIKLISNP